jgi:hypothetical protein
MAGVVVVYWLVKNSFSRFSQEMLLYPMEIISYSTTSESRKIVLPSADVSAFSRTTLAALWIPGAASANR